MKRRRRNADAALLVTLESDDELRGPELPEGVLGEDDGEPVDWHPMTKVWWESWRRSPMAQTFGETDWLFLLDTALMHHTMWAKSRWEFASEVRLRAAKVRCDPGGPGQVEDPDRGSRIHPARFRCRARRRTPARRFPHPRPPVALELERRAAGRRERSPG